MGKRRGSWFLHLMSWFRGGDSQEVPAEPLTKIEQNTSGNHNQVIGQVYGGTPIANVEQIIQHFHLPPQEILSLESFWANWSLDTEPPLSRSLVIGGREQSCDQVLSWLRGAPSSFALQGDSSEEAIAFLAAVVQGLNEEERTRALSRAFIVNGASSWQHLITSSEPLILIPRFNQPKGVGTAIRNGHHVFVALGRIGGENAVPLPRILWNAAQKSLEEMGFSWDRARDLATLARRSLPALRRKLAIAKGFQQPAWARPEAARSLMAPLLASAWDTSCQGDRDALSQLSGMPYEQLESILVCWANEPDPPLRRVGDTWMVVVQEEAWRLIARYLTDDDLQRFESVAIDILGELDPAFELPPEQRYAASIYGKVLTRSERLRESVAETLALMATLSSEIKFTANRTGEKVANSIIGRLLEMAKTNSTLWASLASQLPLLAEAAPDFFLGAVNEDLSGQSPILVNLFQDRAVDTAFMCCSPHTGLLWALENLAWNPNYLSQVILNLARLTRLDPGGRLANRPASSLRTIIVSCFPNTTASRATCLKILDNIRKQESKVAWNLLMSLLPQLHGGVFQIHKTRWRDWVPDHRISLDIQGDCEMTNAILERLISDADGNIARWCSLVVSARRLSNEQRTVLLNALEVLDPEQFSSEKRVQMCDCLRKEINEHREYSDAKWAMPFEVVQRLEATLVRFEPEDLVKQYRWLFKQSYCVELLGKRNLSWQQRETAIEQLRTEALQKIFDSQGWSGVMQLAQQAAEPSTVGITLAKAQLLPMKLGQLLRDNFWSLNHWQSAVAKSYVLVNAYDQGEQWIEDCLTANAPTWNSEEYGEFLRCLPFTVHLLDRVDAAPPETQQYFWNHIQNIEFLGVDCANRVLTSLLEFGRSHLATNAIAWRLEDISELFSPLQIAEVLEASVQTTPKSDFDFRSFADSSAELMNYLEKTDLPRDLLARLELIYFQIHQHCRRPHTLLNELGRNPELFIEALGYIFSPKSKTEDINEDQGVAPEPSIWELAWNLLETWKQMPGVSEDGSVDVMALRWWVMRVRELASERDRSEIADIYIGHTLAFSPIDPDGAWPHVAVRDLIEELASSTIEQGWRTQIINNRGFTTRFPTDGGEQERELVRQYEDYAQQITDQWPRTAAALREMANRYRQQATEHDQRADLTQDFGC